MPARRAASAEAGGPARPGDGRPRVVIVGLGPAGPELTTPAAREAVDQAPVAFVRTRRHPAAAALGDEVVALDDCYEDAQSFEEVYERIAARVRDAAFAYGEVAYAVPGSPTVGEASVVRLRADPSLDCVVVPGLSFAGLAFARLGVDPLAARARLVDAASFATDAAGDPGPFLVAQCWSRSLLSEVKLALDEEPDEPATLLHHLGLPDERVVAVRWSELDRVLEPDHLTSLWVPRLASPPGAELVGLVELARTLRERCPWDRAQTHRSVLRHLLEESHEALEALEALGDSPTEAGPEVVAHAQEELGDLLFQVVFHSLLASEEGLFDLAEVARAEREKLVARHPHVFGATEAGSAEAVLARWERAKLEEKGRAGLLEGVPATLPALAVAAKLERKLAGFGLGWPQGLASARAGPGPAPGAALDPGEAVASALVRLLAGERTLAGAVLLDLARAVAHLGADPEAELRASLRSLGAESDVALGLRGERGRDC
jgi:tetrapyrrole methylase family protein/MazG family protein